MSKSLKFGNGQGSISKLSGARRKPFVVRSSASYHIDESTGKLKETRQIIGYAKTKEEAYKMLLEYNDCPLNLAKAKITFEDLYNEFSESHFRAIATNTQRGYSLAYKHCELIQKRVFRDLKLKDYERLFDEATDKNGNLLSQQALKMMKILIGLISDYAMKNDIIVKDYSKFIDVKKYKDRECKTIAHKPFKDEDIQILWNNQDNWIAQICLCLIYTGLRIDKELFNIKKANVDIEGQFIEVVESKTESGKRLVPIPDKILPIIKKWYDEGESEYLFHKPNGERFVYLRFMEKWNPYFEMLKMDYKPHDTRHTYNSMLANLGINTDEREFLMGHKGNNVNEKIYTHRSKERMLEIVNQL